MWFDLPENERLEYKRMILAFASLTEMFAQKDDDDEIPAPKIVSKYQETVFQKVFGASGEDIGNTSYDAAIERIDSGGTVSRYLVGIKTFGVGTNSQKIAQFKSNNGDWSDIVAEMNQNGKDALGNDRSKSEIDSANHDLYLELAEKVAEIRNKRISSSEATIRGFDRHLNADKVESVYHVLMPSPKGETPKIHVGETNYSRVDIPNISILGCTGKSTPTNFKFTDGIHEYSYSASDCQLSMKFDNANIIQESWDVKYADDAYAIFSNIADMVYKTEASLTKGSPSSTEVLYLTRVLQKKRLARYTEIIVPTESYSWMIATADGEVPRYSGFNAFFGVSRKQKLTSSQADILARNLENRYSWMLDGDSGGKARALFNLLREYLLTSSSDDQSRAEKESMRNRILKITDAIRYYPLKMDILYYVFRPKHEMYIPLPNARAFHQTHPDFFGKGIGALKKVGSKWKLVNEKENRVFTMVFDPSGDEMEMFISQDSGKGIESYGRQTILGEWLMQKVFMLDEYEPLTTKRLNELGINGIRLSKYLNDERIHFRFIWIDEDNLPNDYIG